MKNYIPTINISSLLKSDFNLYYPIILIKKLKKLVYEVGFFQIIGHGIEIRKINNICKKLQLKE